MTVDYGGISHFSAGGVVVVTLVIRAVAGVGTEVEGMVLVVV